MANSEIMSIGIMAISLATFGVQAVRIPLERMMPPPIEGSAEVAEPVRAGQIITVPWTITKRIKCQGATGRVWTGADGFSMTEPLRPASLPALNHPANYSIETQIPFLAPVGPLELRVSGYFECPRQDRIWWEIGPVAMEVIP